MYFFFFCSSEVDCLSCRVLLQKEKKRKELLKNRKRTANQKMDEIKKVVGQDAGSEIDKLSQEVSKEYFKVLSRIAKIQALVLIKGEELYLNVWLNDLRALLTDLEKMRNYI